MKNKENEAPKKDGITENKTLKDMLLEQVSGGLITIPLVHEFVDGKCITCQLEYDVYIASGRSIPCK